MIFDYRGACDVNSLSIFFPAYNDAATISGLVDQAVRVAAEITPDFEVIVVDDGSRDATGAVADRLAACDPRVRVVHHERNRGYGAALMTGFLAARKQWVFYTDGDGQYDVADLQKLALRVTPGVGLVNGYKLTRADALPRVLLGRMYHHVVRLAFNLPIRDVDCDFRLMPRALVQGLTLRTTSGAICVELVRKMQRTGHRIEEVPVRHLPRGNGRSEFMCPRHVARALAELPGLWLDLVARPLLSRARSAS
jgi:glycosyltransferase involved in cell wall biosynthesis